MDEQDKRTRFQELIMPHLDAAYNLAHWLIRNALTLKMLCRRHFCAHSSFSMDFTAATVAPGCSRLFAIPATIGFAQTGKSGVADKSTVRQGYNLVHWTESGMTFWAVSDLNRADLTGFAQLMK
jgi:hypothetical protein